MIKSIKKMKKSYNVISVMLSRLAIVCKRVLAKCGFNCFKAAEHRGGSREVTYYNQRGEIITNTKIINKFNSTGVIDWGI